MKQRFLSAAIVLMFAAALASGCAESGSGSNAGLSVLALLNGTHEILGVVTRLAGSDGGPGYRDGDGTAARFKTPYGITSDGTNLFVADTYNHAIRRIAIATGEVTTLAGSAAGESGSTDGTGTAARFNVPKGLFSDGTSLFVADSGNHTIRKIVIATGEVTTLAGTAGMPGTADGTGAAARFHGPVGITGDGTNLYICDEYNNSIRQVVIATGVAATLAGSTSGESGTADENGTAARFHYPMGITRAGTDLYVTDYWNHTIRKIESDGDVTTIAGTAGQSTPQDGTGAGAYFSYPYGITNDGTNLYVADYWTHAIRKIVISSAVVTTLAGSVNLPGTADGTGTAARFRYPMGITSDAANLYVADTSNHSIRKIVAATGAVTTFSGTPGVQGTADGTGTGARFNVPDGTYSNGADLFVADSNNHTIRRIVIATGAVTTFAGSPGGFGSNDSTDGTGVTARFQSPRGLTGNRTCLYVADTGNHTIRKVVIATGETTTLAGLAGASGSDDSSDGTGATARFQYPRGLYCDGTCLYVADSGNYTIRKVVIATGKTTTLAGLAGASGSDDSSDGTGATARFNAPYAITRSGENLYVADMFNNSIRRVAVATGETALFAGSATGENGPTDGTGTEARFDGPHGITSDGTSLYVSDYSNHTIRKIVVSSAVVTTLAGIAGGYGSMDGTGASASFNYPAGITFNAAKYCLFVTDSGNNCIRRIN